MLREGRVLFVLGGLVLSACVDGPPEPGEELATTTEELTFGNLSNIIQVKRGGLCLVAPASGNGPVTQQPCLSTPTHWWKVVQSPIDPGFYYIENIVNGSHRCLDVPQSSSTSNSEIGLDLQAFTCHRQASQLFRISRSAFMEWKIQPKLGVQHNLCLDIEGGGTNPGARLQQFTCKTIDVDNQRFLAVLQQQEPVFLDCDSDDFLRVNSVDSAVTLFQTNIAHFNARSFAYGCDDLTTPDSYSCPSGTNTFEISRNYVDEFRVKCALR